METVGIIIGVLVIIILLVVLVSYLIVLHTANKVKKRAGKYLAEKGEQAVLHVGKKLSEKYLDKK